MRPPSGVSVHPLGLCESDSVGAGTTIWAFAHVLAGAVVGEDCKIGDHVFIEGGARLGDRVTVKNAVLIWDGVVVDNDVFLGPNVVFTNDLRPRARVRRAGDELLETHVGAGATIGANATVVCGVTIGPHAFVAAGSVVTGDVAPNGLVAGNPAVHKGWVCECGEGLDGDLTCGSCGRSHDFDRRRPDPAPHD